jgi:hypothetical protein
MNISRTDSVYQQRLKLEYGFRDFSFRYASFEMT